ncbi:redoxin domain-containing protein [Sporosarcina sp. CAU 1771]
MKLYEQMPEFTNGTTWLNGRVTKSDLIGNKPILIHFWSVSCYLCKGSVQEINELKALFNQKLTIIAVHMPRSEKDLDIEVIKNRAREYNMKHPIIVDDNVLVTDAFENEQVPACYLFDRNGRLRHFQSGERGMQLVKKRILRLLNEKD